MKANYNYSVIIQDASQGLADQASEVISQEHDRDPGILRQDAQVKSKSLSRSPDHTCKNKSYTSIPVTLAKSPCVLHEPKTNFLSNITIKWTGNNKEICKISIIILQLLLIYLLLNKTDILSPREADFYRNTSIAKTHLRSASLLPVDEDSKTSNEQEQQQLTVRTRITSTPSTVENCEKIEASSENEYKKSSTWKLENSSSRSEMIEKLILVGNTDTKQLSVVLNRFNFANKISFGQVTGKFGLIGGAHIISHNLGTKIYLLNLNEIIFENINGTHIFDYLSQRFYVNAVKSLRIKSIEIDESNVIGIRQFLKQCKYSLEILELSEVMWKVAIYDSFSYAVPNLKELRIDFLFPIHKNIEFLGGFKAAEQLSKIISMRGYLPYSQFLSVFDFKFIKYLTLGVEISDEVTSLDNLFPIDVLHMLEYMELYLKFSNTSKCYLLIDYNIERSYETKLHSNCDEDF